MDILMQGVLIRFCLPCFGTLTLTIAGPACELVGYILIGTIVFIICPNAGIEVRHLE
jgi:hypothetical protein